jgi:hypothetical protein
LSISVRSHALASARVATAFIGQGSGASQLIAVIKPRVIADGATLAHPRMYLRLDSSLLNSAADWRCFAFGNFAILLESQTT